ncbi:MAG: response regulator [Veillonellaceae bacterium]|nr:response regulator [Veillonellaceae bacterium]MDD6923524.1 response regulator [Veillonellaceae bacterium]
MRILIAEDDRISRTFMKEFMKEYGKCDVAVDGMEALDLFMDAVKKEDPYRLICLDIMMPKVDGLKVLRVIRAMEKQHDVPQEKRARILMTTALADLDYVDQAFKLGADGYAAKPIDTDKITEVIRNMGLIGEKLEAHPTDTGEQ